MHAEVERMRVFASLTPGKAGMERAPLKEHNGTSIQGTIRYAYSKGSTAPTFLASATTARPKGWVGRAMGR